MVLESHVKTGGLLLLVIFCSYYRTYALFRISRCYIYTTGEKHETYKVYLHELLQPNIQAMPMF